VPEPQGLLKHSLCVQQSMIARLADAGEADAGGGEAGEGEAGGGEIRGFKELLQLPSLDVGGEFASEYAHLSTRPEVRRELDWVP
jgi:hypothetical protein